MALLCEILHAEINSLHSDLYNISYSFVDVRKSLEDYSFELKKVAHSIATAIGRILNIDPELMSDKYAVQVLRMNYYPPCTSMPEKVLGFSPHSDGSFLTILSQVNSVQGLQIRRHDAWIPVKPHPEALLVNVGDLLEVLISLENLLMYSYLLVGIAI